jgi:hypothetical protein
MNPSFPHLSARLLWRWALLVIATLPIIAKAQTDEIQVYTGELAEPGEFTLTLHNNYTPNGLKTPAFPGGVRPDGTLNGVPEFAYGATEWLELGTYLPVYSVSPGGHYYVESVKLRALFAVPHAEKRQFFYGLNFELSRNASRWEEARYSGEMRPIIGLRFGAIDFIVNPILDTTFSRVSDLEFAPSTRLAYNASSKWAFAVEHYADLGTLRRLLPAREQSQSLFLVADYSGKTGIEFGIGHGLNGATDELVFKLMLSSSLNRR